MSNICEQEKALRGDAFTNFQQTNHNIAAWAAQNGILKGGLDGNANLLANVTRGQACALAGRTMGTLA